MKVRSIFRSRRNKFIIGISGTAGLLVWGCIFLRIHSFAEFESFLQMAGEAPPVWRQFAFRRFGPGDSVAELLRRFPPSGREEFGRYGVYGYGGGFIGLGVTTRDGKILSARAGSCTWRYTFFSTDDPEIDRAYEAFRKERHESLERRELDRLEIALRHFYLIRDRWPINPEEFSNFVTHTPSVTTNDFQITLVQQADGAMEIAFIDLPGEKRSVAKPAR
jgi:hypothetical protein